MAQAYGTRPSTLLGVDDPLAAYQLDHAVFALHEAIDDALAGVRARFDLKDLDARGRRRVREVEAAMNATLERILHGAPEPVEDAGIDERPIEYLWNDARTDIVGWRYADEAAG